MYITLAILLTVTLWAWSGLKKLDVGWKGQILLLGRRTSLFVGEGWIWAAWPFDIKVADCRKVVVKLDSLSVFTQDNILVKVEGSLVRQISDLNAYFGVDEREIKKGIDDLWDQEIRSRIITKDLLDALSFQVDLGHNVQPAMKNRAMHWGIEIPEVLIASIQPNEKVTADLELKEREKLQQNGQMIEARHFASLVSFFAGEAKLGNDGPIGPKLPVELAYEAALIQIGKAESKKIASNTLGLDKATVDAIVQAVIMKGGK